MRINVSLLAALLVPLLTVVACSSAPRSAQALAVDDPCAGATTGDMYRYCREVGPEEALRNDPAPGGQPQTARQAD